MGSTGSAVKGKAGDLSLLVGTSDNVGGNVLINAGAATGSAKAGGNVVIQSGDSTNAASGAIQLSTKAVKLASGNDSGPIQLTTGASSNGKTGAISLTSGAAAAGTAGDISITVGASGKVTGGKVAITGGASQALGGKVTITGGASTSASGGNIEINGGSGAGSSRGNVIVQAGELEVAALTTIELVAKTNFDIKGTTTFVDSTSLTLAGTNIKVKDKGKNKEYDLLKFLADNSRRLTENNRRLDAIEKKAEDDDGPTTEELSSQIKELWEILQMMQKHYVKLMKKDASAQSQK